MVRFITPIRFDKLTRIVQIRGVDTFVHWTVFVVAAFILAGVAHDPWFSLVGIASYLTVIFVHEIGHLVAAQRLGCRVDSITIYPFFGITRFETPWTRLDHCVIAWSGVLAQIVVGVPLVLWVVLFGYSRFEAANVLFVILGFFSVAVAMLNLLPIPPLDGAIAWGLLSALRQRRKAI